MKTKPRTDISEEERFLLKIKYGNEDVAVESIHESDYEYFEKLDREVVYNNIGSITEQMAELIDFDNLDGDAWDMLLSRVPELGVHCDWCKLRGIDWSCLLQRQPQFAEYCDWSKLDGRDWTCLLREHPQFAELCDWSNFGGRDWLYLLREQPQFAEHCDWGKT